MPVKQRAKYGSVKRRVVLCLKQGPATTGELAVSLNIHYKLMYAHMRGFRKRGLVTPISKWGHSYIWSLTDAQSVRSR